MASAPDRSRLTSLFRGRLSVRNLIALPILAVAVAVLVPIAILVILGFRTSTALGQGSATGRNYSAVFGSSSILETIGNTIAFTFGGALLAVVLGTLMAWAVTSVRIPGRSILRVLPVCSIILPPLVKDPAWIIFFSKRTGLVNIAIHKVFGIDNVFNVFSLPGMISVAGVFAAPIAYIIMLSPFTALDRSLVEASQVSGARLWRTLFTVVLPVVRPALLSATVLLMILVGSSFETPVLIGLPGNVSTFIGQLYGLVTAPVPQLNQAAAQGTVYLVLTALLLVGYVRATRHESRFVAVGGRGQQQVLLEGRAIRTVMFIVVLGYSIVSFLAPLTLTVLVSFLPFYSAVNGNPFHDFTTENFRTVFTSPDIVHGIVISGVLAAVVALGAVTLAGVLAYVSLKSKSRFRRACEVIAMAPVAVPAIVFSFGLLLTVLSSPTLAEIGYGSRWLMAVAEIVVFIPIAMRLVSSALIQVQDELLEVSQSCGAGVGRSVRVILLPILRGAILYAAAAIFVLSYRELGAVVLLAAQNTPVVPYMSFTAWVSGGYPELAALNVVTLLVPLVIVGIMFSLAAVPNLSLRRNRRRWQPASIELVSIAST